MSLRRVRGEWVTQPRAHRSATDSGSGRLMLPFALAGHVTAWEPIHRHLEIGARAFGLAPGVPATGLAAGVHVTIAGYVERLAESASRSIVTRLVVG
jgi:hypothetical protein